MRVLLEKPPPKRTGRDLAEKGPSRDGRRPGRDRRSQRATLGRLAEKVHARGEHIDLDVLGEVVAENFAALAADPAARRTLDDGLIDLNAKYSPRKADRAHFRTLRDRTDEERLLDDARRAEQTKVAKARHGLRTPYFMHACLRASPEFTGLRESVFAADAKRPGPASVPWLAWSMLEHLWFSVERKQFRRTWQAFMENNAALSYAYALPTFLQRLGKHEHFGEAENTLYKRILGRYETVKGERVWRNGLIDRVDPQELAQQQFNAWVRTGLQAGVLAPNFGAVLHFDGAAGEIHALQVSSFDAVDEDDLNRGSEIATFGSRPEDGVHVRGIRTFVLGNASGGFICPAVIVYAGAGVSESHALRFALEAFFALAKNCPDYHLLLRLRRVITDAAWSNHPATIHAASHYSVDVISGWSNATSVQKGVAEGLPEETLRGVPRHRCNGGDPAGVMDLRTFTIRTREHWPTPEAREDLGVAYGDDLIPHLAGRPAIVWECVCGTPTRRTYLEDGAHVFNAHPHEPVPSGQGALGHEVRNLALKVRNGSETTMQVMESRFLLAHGVFKSRFLNRDHARDVVFRGSLLAYTLERQIALDGRLQAMEQQFDRDGVLDPTALPHRLGYQRVRDLVATAWPRVKHAGIREGLWRALREMFGLAPDGDRDEPDD